MQKAHTSSSNSNELVVMVGGIGGAIVCRKERSFSGSLSSSMPVYGTRAMGRSQYDRLAVYQGWFVSSTTDRCRALVQTDCGCMDDPPGSPVKLKRANLTEVYMYFVLICLT